MQGLQIELLAGLVAPTESGLVGPGFDQPISGDDYWLPRVLCFENAVVEYRRHLLRRFTARHGYGWFLQRMARHWVSLGRAVSAPKPSMAN
jgi:hypothetical protein